MKIFVNKTMKASDNGIDVKQYLAGEVYEMSEEMSELFVSQKWGVKQEDSKAFKDQLENKAVQKVEEDKAIIANKTKPKTKKKTTKK
jgi:hypothetical protein